MAAGVCDTVKLGFGKRRESEINTCLAGGELPFQIWEAVSSVVVLEFESWPFIRHYVGKREAATIIMPKFTNQLELLSSQLSTASFMICKLGNDCVPEFVITADRAQQYSGLLDKTNMEQQPTKQRMNCSRFMTGCSFRRKRRV